MSDQEDITVWHVDLLDELAVWAHARTDGVEIRYELPGPDHNAEHGENMPEEMHG